MKKIVSFITAAIMAVMLFVPAFAADTVIFNITLVSESDTEAVVTFDYVGGSSFNSLDFEITLSDRLSVVSGGKSAGLKKFQSNIEDNGQMMIAQLNTQKKPVMGAMATTASFDGKIASDLFTLTLKKSVKDSLQEGDIKVNVTNCAYSVTAGSTKTLEVTVTSDLGKPVTSRASMPSGITQANTPDNSKATNVADSSVLTNENGETISADAEQTELTVNENAIDNSKESSEAKTAKTKKYISIGAVVFCVLLIITAVVLVVAKKTTGKSKTKETNNSDEKSDETNEKE